MPRNTKALVIWTREQKTGVEPLTHVPENARFVGSVTPVQFSGDKKYYPAKIIMISVDADALLERSSIEEIAISKRKAEAEVKSQTLQSNTGKRSRRTTKNVQNPSVASDREVAAALGSRPPVPKALENVQKGAKKAKKNVKIHHSVGQKKLDDMTLASIRKTLFTKDEGDNHSIHSDAHDENDVENTEDEKSCEDEASDGDSGAEKSDDECADASSADKKCNCETCVRLLKYDAPVYVNFLNDITSIFQAVDKGGSEKIQYLELKEIPATTKQVELVSGKGVFIALHDKEQLRFHFKNKPSSLARETLFTVFGRDAFKVLSVTGRGSKKGTYAIADNILESVCRFINRNVTSDQSMKLSDLVSLINKRAPEWRKSSPASKPKQPRAKKNSSSSRRKVISTSPFKVSSLKSKTAASSDLASPLKSSPLKPSPLKPVGRSPFKSLNLLQRLRSHSLPTWLHQHSKPLGNPLTKMLLLIVRSIFLLLHGQV